VTDSSIRVINLYKSFDNLLVLKNISFELSESGIYGILGKNGAGKTTLIGILMGLITPTKGKVFILNKDLKKRKYEILEKINFQSPYVDLPKKMTVRQNLIFYSRLYGISNKDDVIEKLSKELELSSLLDKLFGSLSAGQKTKVSLCKALLNQPKVLLLDEPTASLDPETSLFIRNYLKEYQIKNKALLLLASHNLDEIQSMCSYIFILNNGKLVLKGKLKSLLKKEYSSVLDLFLREG